MDWDGAGCCGVHHVESGEVVKVVAEIQLSEDVWLSPRVIDMTTLREVWVVLARIRDKVRKIGVVPVPKEERVLTR